MLTEHIKETNSVPRSFSEIAFGLGLGEPAPPGWQPLAARSLLILVGVTGVGKSTTIAALREAGLDFHLLPNRRALADQLIIPEVQALDGLPIQPVRDRTERFALTRRYRERYPGGIVHALAQLWVSPVLQGSLLFDGLRGENEVRCAVEQLPLAYFVLLDAPDWVRVQRLLNRNDAFDRASAVPLPGVEGSVSGLKSLAELGMPEAAALFTSSEEQALLSLLIQEDVTLDDLRAKLSIVIAERRSYDPAATRQTLACLALARSVIVDTSACAPDHAAQLILEKLGAGI
jgi:hypothetical protein